VSERAFVLTPIHRMHGGKPQVQLHAILECGEPALVIDDRLAPYFFVRKSDVARVGREVTPTALTTFADEPVSRVEVSAPADVPPLRRRLEDAGVECFEADIRFAYRYLIDRDVRGAFAVDGPFERHAGVGRVYLNPTLTPAAWTPKLRVLSLDIETSLDGGSLYCIGVSGAGGERVWMVGERPVAGVEIVPDERTVLERFLAHLRGADPDVLTGWNVTDFDLVLIQRFCRRHGLRCTLGRSDDELEILRDQSYTREGRAVLGGRVVLDGLALVRGAFIKLDDYRLETAARAILGAGKLVTGDDRGVEIERMFRVDQAKLAAYNLQDARLVVQLLERTGLIELTVRRSLMTGMQLDRVGAQIAAIDSLYLRALRARGRVAPSVRRPRDEELVGITGGLVLDSRPGLYRNIAVFDFKSLYPSLIRTFNIDPLTHVPRAREHADAIVTPGGMRFRRDEPGILPALVARLWDERARFREEGDATGAQATKILMNSLFGVLGSPASRLFSPAVANAITLAGQHVIRLAAAAMAARGHRVIYGDTDSVFVDLGEPDTAAAERRGAMLAGDVGAEVGATIAREFGCTSHLELEFEKVYARFFMPEVRGGATGSKKRYAGLVRAKLEIVGLEAVRRDWSEVARRFQRELLDRLFRDQPVHDFAREFVGRLRAGAFDGDLAYRKAIRKPLSEYTKTTPAHVKAARKVQGGPGRIVTYVVTRAGPEPHDALSAPPDHEHYVEHQLKPIADAILRFVDGPEFDELSGAQRQLSLF